MSERELERLRSLVGQGDVDAASRLRTLALRERDLVGWAIAACALHDWEAVGALVSAAWLGPEEVAASRLELARRHWLPRQGEADALIEYLGAACGLSLSPPTRDGVSSLARHHRVAMPFPVATAELAASLVETALNARWHGVEPPFVDDATPLEWRGDEGWVDLAPNDAPIADRPSEFEVEEREAHSRVDEVCHAFGSLPIGHAVRERVLILAVWPDECDHLTIGITDGEAHRHESQWPEIVAPGAGESAPDALVRWAQNLAADRALIEVITP